MRRRSSSSSPNPKSAMQEILTKANADAQKMIDEARASAQAVADKRTQQAISEAEQIIAKAREATGIEREKILAELKREVGRLVIDTTAKVTGKVLTPTIRSASPRKPRAKSRA